MAGIKTVEFYVPWPRFGQALSKQWDDLRENHRSLAPLARAAYIDENDIDPNQDDLAGWAIGELDFRNKFRIFYEKATDQFMIQQNTGTEAIPVWNSRVKLRESDGRLIVTGSGGIEAVGGFYGIDTAADFYGITVALTGGPTAPTLTGIKKMNFDADLFYFSQNAPNTDEVTISLRTLI